MSLNFAPYSSPPGTPRATSSLLPPGSASSSSGQGRAAAAAGAAAASSSSSPYSSSNRASRPKSPWFSVGSYQSGARAGDLNSHNAVSSSSSSSSYPSHQVYPGNSGGGGDVLWDAENGSVEGGAGGYASSSMGSAGGGYASGSTGAGHDQYETTFGWRVDVEAAAAYILGPFLAILLLILEVKNDYVRFHAWQSLLLGAGLAILHLLLMWSRFLSWVLVLVDVAVYGQLAYRAFCDGDTLQRYFLPRIGDLAHQWTEDE